MVFSQKYDQRRALRLFLSLLALFVMLTEVLRTLVKTEPLAINSFVAWPFSQLLIALLMIPVVTYFHHQLERQAQLKLLLLAGAALVYGLLLHLFSGVATLLLERLLKLPEHYQAARFLSQVQEQWPPFLYYALLYVAQLGLLELLRMRLLLQTERERNTRLTGLNRAGELASLRYRLNPHFLFNSLNNISMVIRKGEQDKAVDSIISLREILSKTMDKDQQPFISLSQELELIQHFIEIEKLRNETRKIVLDVDKRSMKLQVPALFVQPIVENAFKFAEESGSGSPAITIKAVQLENRLKVTVFNSGSHFSAGAAADGSGIGLMNTIHRLRYIYGTDFSFTSRDHSDGVEIEIDIPAVS